MAPRPGNRQVLRANVAALRPPTGPSGGPGRGGFSQETGRGACSPTACRLGCPRTASLTGVEQGRCPQGAKQYVDPSPHEALGLVPIFLSYDTSQGTPARWRFLPSSAQGSPARPHRRTASACGSATRPHGRRAPGRSSGTGTSADRDIDRGEGTAAPRQGDGERQGSQEQQAHGASSSRPTGGGPDRKPRGGQRHTVGRHT